MHVIGARFADLESANAALGEIRACVAIPRGDVAVRPLGSTRYEEQAADFLLAGRFSATEVERVVGIVEQHGGTLLSRQIEWPHPSLAGGSATTNPGSGRDVRGRAPERHGSQVSRFGAAPALHQGAHTRVRRSAALVHVRVARDRRFSV